MKSITLHKLDDTLSESLEHEARRRGHSLNQTVKDLLRYALGIDQSKTVDHTHLFLDQFGTWTEEDEAEFNERVAGLNRVDPRDWSD